MSALLVHKNVLLLMSLITYVTSLMMVGVMSWGLIVKTKVTMTNKISEPLSIHCRDTFNDDGNYTFEEREKHHFKVVLNPFTAKTLWYCSFGWKGAFHGFDIYDKKRDKNCNNSECIWDIFQEGPCRFDPGDNGTTCFQWDKKKSRR
ncbi:putative plant self-incompatibility S1 [Lupinus albus]|uniref:S-protein homolog n=1 Tax=Lupinus albus TaxID=3870 RepID=A0A6A4QEL8_LUPAL|nr:putative plant self-incompatibility S1 [Lupinus albus]